MNEEFLVVIIVGIIVLAVSLIPYIFFILTLQNTLLKVHEKNRTMAPTETWLLLIPLFNIIWMFIVVNKMADSLAAEFRMRNINVNQVRPGYDVGLAYCICACCSIIPILGAFSGLAAFVLWIVYWVKINEFKTKLSRPYDANPELTNEKEDWFNSPR